MSIIIKSGSTSDLADVDTNKNLKVNLPTDIADSGFAVAVGEVHDGLGGAAREVRALDVTPDFRLRSGSDSILWQDCFNHSILNTSLYQVVTSVMTTGFATGFLQLNAGNSTTSGAVARVQSYKNFVSFGSYPLYVEFWSRFVLAPQTNNVCEMGIGYANGTATPTDGVYFKLESSGNLVGVVNYNGVETTTSALSAVSANVVRHYLIVIEMDSAEFWINGVLQATLPRVSTQPSMALSLSAPLLFRLYNSAATASAQRFELASINVSQGDMNNSKSWETQMGGIGQGMLSAPSGQTVAQLQNYANSAAPTSAGLSNTSAGYSNLGGQFQFAAVAGAETDYALFGYNVPLGTATIPGKSFYLKGIAIDTWNTVVAVATTATVMQWAVAVGSTAVSLATTDSGTSGTRAPRRVVVGAQTFPVGAAVGAMASRVFFEFDVPLMAEPGTFVHVILKMPIATATATEIFRGVVTINGFFE